jgi:hypothetical protein
MSFQRTIVGAHIKIYINGVAYQEAQSLSFNIDYGEEPIYGIDSVFPQEIKTTRISVEGRIEGLRIANSAGLQGYQIRPGIRQSVFAAYISIRAQDRRTGEDIIFIPFAKVKNESTQVSAKGVMKTSFSFSGLQPLQPLDRV